MGSQERSQEEPGLVLEGLKAPKKGAREAQEEPWKPGRLGSQEAMEGQKPRKPGGAKKARKPGGASRSQESLRSPE